MPHGSKALRRFNHLLSETAEAYHDASVRLGLSYSMMQILYTVYDYGDGRRCPLREVCVQTGISKQTINSALRRLEGEGIARLEQTGGKRKDVCLTEAGLALARRTVARIMAVEDGVFASWRPEDVETYLTLTKRYLTAFREGIQNLEPEQEHQEEP